MKQEITYRIPYMGSKQSIVKNIYEAINRDIGNTDDLFATNKIDTIYDLFCGGGAIGYYFSQKGYKVYMNDIQEPLIALHRVLQLPSNKSPLTKELLYKWIDREEFFELTKRQDWYGELIRCCWSFGNAGRTYLFGKEIELYKKALHFVVVNKSEKAGLEFLEMIGKQDDFDNFKKIYQIESQREKRSFIRKYIIKNTQNKQFPPHNNEYLCCYKNDYEIIKDLSIVEKAKWLNENKRKLIELQELESIEQLTNLKSITNLESIARLESIEQLTNLEEKIIFTSKNYYEIYIQPNSIIYCDPPYINTAGYSKQTFDFERFDNWVREMKNKGIRVYISEYTNHNNEWREVASICKMSLMNNTKKTKTRKQEKIFCNI